VGLTIDEKRLAEVLAELEFSRPDVVARCKPGMYLRPDGDELVANMVDAEGEVHEVGRFPLSRVAVE
jgi:hypothetical protein